MATGVFRQRYRLHPRPRFIPSYPSSGPISVTPGVASLALATFAPTVSQGASAAVTGTATASITETDIVAGGKTVVITLTGATWED